MEAKKNPDLKPDGKLHPIGDAMECHPDFQEEFELMSDEFFKEHNPGYHAMIQRLKKESGSDGGEEIVDEGAAKED